MRLLAASFLGVVWFAVPSVTPVAAQAPVGEAAPTAETAGSGAGVEQRTVEGAEETDRPSGAALAGEVAEAEPAEASAAARDVPAATEGATDGSAQVASGDHAADREAMDDAALLRERVSVARTHRLLGLATWGAMTATVVLGAIQYYNLYGFFSPLESTPCVQGSAVFGQGQCSGTPWLHLSASLLTAGLYTATGLLAWRMPVPEGYTEGSSRHARNVRLHRLLRWVHLGGMIAQMLLGYVTANAQQFGIDRANDYGTLQALATVHQGIGLVTWGALTWAGWLFL